MTVLFGDRRALLPSAEHESGGLCKAEASIYTKSAWFHHP
jgi:hypothetical protein